MLEEILKLYYMAMAYDTRSPMPHLVGPPGCGKSSSVEQAAEMLGVNLHVLNVSRVSPLEIEGAQFPHGDGDDLRMKLLHNQLWKDLKEGDIVLMDEFLRGFPEVYNGLLDILTSRRVMDLHLPKVFFIGASNSVITYDPALEDRLLHMPVPDIRTNRRAFADTCSRLCEALGILPYEAHEAEVNSVINNEVRPLYAILDRFKGQSHQLSNTVAPAEGHSLRNLIGQAQMRLFKSSELHDMLLENNRQAVGEAKYQYVLLPDGKPQTWHDKYLTFVNQVPLEKLTPIQRINMQMNIQLLELEKIKKEGVEANVESPFVDDEPPF